MKKYCLFLCLTYISLCHLFASNIKIPSPDGFIILNINNQDSLFYSISYKGQHLIKKSALGFEFKNEKPMNKGFILQNTPSFSLKEDFWRPVVKNKHESIHLKWNEAHIYMIEKENEFRRMDMEIRVFNSGVAFRYTLYGGRQIGDRKITNELTEFSIPDSSNVWIADYQPHFHSPQEGQFIKTPATQISPNTLSGLPLLIEVNSNNYMAITEAYIDNYPGFYISTSQKQSERQIKLTTKLAPLPGEQKTGIKVRFNEKINTPWRVIMIGNNPGTFIESEIIQSLNPPCTIKDTSWIRPGMCAWDHWWSGEVDMKMETIKEYIDLAAQQGWPYMLIDWQWYGPFNTPEADVTRPASQLNMPEILSYAKSRNVRCWLWLYCTDINKNDKYKEAFALYEKWGIAGVKIDFMDRDDQEMVNWYRKIVQEAAQHRLLVNFHGAYKPDGMERTYPNLLTREGVMGGEHYKFGKGMSPEHNITLAFTRMLAGPMDYTPGGFLNVTDENFKVQVPTLVTNTRCAELAKFIIYESPLTVIADHPKHILQQPGSDFLKIVPTVWDETRFIEGYPREYIVMAKRSGSKWFVGIMNNHSPKEINIDPSIFLPEGEYKLEEWKDKNAETMPQQLKHKVTKLTEKSMLTIKVGESGGYVGIFTPADK